MKRLLCPLRWLVEDHHLLHSEVTILNQITPHR
jgi:hypothetical protein